MTQGSFTGSTARRHLFACSLITLSVAVCLSSAAHAATLFVSKNGNNKNPGTQTAPWATIQYAAEHARAGDIVNIRAGTYEEIVSFEVSGTPGAPITFQSYPGEIAAIDGANQKMSDSGALVTIANRHYLNLVGLEIRNYSTKSIDETPVGLMILDGASHIEIRNNNIHHIATNNTTFGCDVDKTANALGLAVYGTNGSTSVNNILIDGNDIHDLKLGCSESLSINGNVETWKVTNNKVHDNNNIAIDAIGGETISDIPSSDYARDGVISDNLVYNISAAKNTAYKSYSSDGIYCDGCARVIIERNTIHHADYGVEIASEHQGKNSRDVTVRGNVIYSNNVAGLSVGGYEQGKGGTLNCNLVNNSLYNNDTTNSGTGEIQVQWNTSGVQIRNNIVYAGAPNRFTNNLATTSDVKMDNNLYFSQAGAGASTWRWNNKAYKGYAEYQNKTGQDASSVFSDPIYVSLTTPDFHLRGDSPAIDHGVDLGSSVVGTTDKDDTARVKNGLIDIGAYEQ